MCSLVSLWGARAIVRRLLTSIILDPAGPLAKSQPPPVSGGAAPVNPRPQQQSWDADLWLTRPRLFGPGRVTEVRCCGCACRAMIREGWK
jgi:hypothetical protein